ncbi:MAG: tyrosine-type recombinase/integrase [Magnetococcales bacterium]|nr:tyrosine-type recombinase/integrase [Magnetococcales bacterium]
MARFTDRFIQNLEVKPERYDVRETDGFAVRVAPSGTKAWQFIYTFNTKKRRVTLGTYPGMTLKDAKEACTKLRDCLDRGIDPVEWQMEQDRQTAEAKRIEDQTATVAQLAVEYIERWAKPRKRTWEEDQRILNLDVLPAWGTRKAKDITRRDILALLDGIVDRTKQRNPNGSGIMANRTLALVRRMFNFACEQSILEASPCTSVRAPAQEQRRDRVLSEDEIRLFWHGLDTAKISDVSRLALKFLLMTAQRTDEVIEAPWSEFDLAGGWWTIPAERAKNKVSHRVPLSTGALALLARAKGLAGDSPWVFPSPRTSTHMGDTALAHAVHRNLTALGIEDFHPHDLRRTAASLMTGSGTPRLTVSKILNHKEAGVTSIYDRHSYDREKRQALEAWDRQLTAILTGQEESNVVPLHRAS